MTIIGEELPPPGALEVSTYGMTMRFGGFTALDDVSIRIAPGSFHALLRENGAGKSTLVKCMMGFYHASSGQMTVGGREAKFADPRVAHALGPGCRLRQRLPIQWRGDGRWRRTRRGRARR